MSKILRSKILSELLPDLQEFLGLDDEAMRVELETCRQVGGERWLAKKPKNYMEAAKFYQTADHSLAQYVAWFLRDTTICEWPFQLVEHARTLGWGKVLDYGAGLSVHSSIMAEQGCPNVWAADFSCPVFSFAQMRARKYDIPLKFLIFYPDMEVQPLWEQWDCIICVHVIGHSYNPFQMLAEIAGHSQYVFWCSDFRLEEDPKDDIQPMHRRKPPMWDDIFARTFTQVDQWLYKSNVFPHSNTFRLGLDWIKESGWTPAMND